MFRSFRIISVFFHLFLLAGSFCNYISNSLNIFQYIFIYKFLAVYRRIVGFHVYLYLLVLYSSLWTVLIILSLSPVTVSVSLLSMSLSQPFCSRSFLVILIHFTVSLFPSLYHHLAAGGSLISWGTWLNCVIACGRRCGGLWGEGERWGEVGHSGGWGGAGSSLSHYIRTPAWSPPHVRRFLGVGGAAPGPACGRGRRSGDTHPPHLE